MRFSTIMKAVVLWLAIVGSSVAGCHYAFAGPFSVGAQHNVGKPGGHGDAGGNRP